MYIKQRARFFAKITKPRATARTLSGDLRSRTSRRGFRSTAVDHGSRSDIDADRKRWNFSLPLPLLRRRQRGSLGSRVFQPEVEKRFRVAAAGDGDVTAAEERFITGYRPVLRIRWQACRRADELD